MGPQCIPFCFFTFFYFFIFLEVPSPQWIVNRPFSMYSFPICLLVFSAAQGYIVTRGELPCIPTVPNPNPMLLFPYLILWLGSSNRDISYCLDNCPDCQTECSPIEMGAYEFDGMTWRLDTEAKCPSSDTAVGPTITGNAVDMSPSWFHVLQGGKT